MERSVFDRYRLREATGLYWLIDIRQEYEEGYLPPVPLNETGAFLWKALEEGRTKQELPVIMAEKFEISAEEAEEDLEAFLSSLRDKNIRI